jgi:hypothetical protein
MADDPLRTALLDLAHELRGNNLPLILGGGYGLYLKQLQMQDKRVADTLILPEFWPRPRSTEDLDLFLQTEIIASIEQMQAIRSALDALGYSVVEEAKYLHFAKSLGDQGRVKVDFLTGPLPENELRDRLRIKPPRVRPFGDVQLHAYITDEALAFDEGPTQLVIEGVTSDHRPARATVCVPQPFTFLLMKLHAFNDRKSDSDKELGRHHALDLYRIVAMLTREEDLRVAAMCERYRDAPPVIRARQIVANDFGSDTAIGILRLREHELFPARADTVAFRSELKNLFPPP